MKYKVKHVTSYDYTDTVPVCQNEARLTPRSFRGQTCVFHRLRIRPTPASAGRRVDYFGNVVNYFTIEKAHRKLHVTAISQVEVHRAAIPDPGDSPPWEMVRDAARHDRSRSVLDACQFQFDSPRVASFGELRTYAAPSFPPGRPILDAVAELTQRIHTDFRYDAGVTTVDTPLLQVFRERRGVCQDLAHVEIGCLRAIGIPASYVSGYIRTVPPPGRPRLIGADASHAWVGVYCGPLGWIDFDPTNNVTANTDHVTVAWGRDYGDVCPINGMVVGGGRHTITVKVDVQRQDDASATR